MSGGAAIEVDMETQFQSSDIHRGALSQHAAPDLSRLQICMLNTVLAVCCALWAVLNLSVFVSESAIDLGQRRRSFVQALTPQGWAFFTRDPREAWEHAFLVEGDQLKPADIADHRGLPWRGVRRGIRNRGIVLMSVIQAVPRDGWMECNQPLTACYRSFSAKPGHLQLTANDDTGLCGRVLLQQKKTLPWAWRRSYRRTQLPSRVAIVDVACTKD
jgi:antimicrobial peptide system SdpA family protein